MVAQLLFWAWQMTPTQTCPNSATLAESINQNGSLYEGSWRGRALFDREHSQDPAGLGLSDSSAYSLVKHAVVWQALLIH